MNLGWFTESRVQYIVIGILILLLVYFSRSKEIVVVDNSDVIERLMEKSQQNFERAMEAEKEVEKITIQQNDIEELFSDSVVLHSHSREYKDSILSRFKRRHGMRVRF